MSGEITLCFYLVIGACVAFAIFVRDHRPHQLVRAFQTVTALIFWPFYLPALLGSNGSSLEAGSLPPQPVPGPPVDDMATAIQQVEWELDAALKSLNGWADDVLRTEGSRITELRVAWRQQAEKIRELDRLLTENQNPVADLLPLAATTADLQSTALAADNLPLNQITQSEQSRQENLAKLKEVRERWYSDLIATLFSVRHLVTMIHLARYSGQPASRATELVQQISRAVDGLSKGPE